MHSRVASRIHANGLLQRRLEHECNVAWHGHDCTTTWPFGFKAFDENNRVSQTSAARLECARCAHCTAACLIPNVAARLKCARWVTVAQPRGIPNVSLARLKCTRWQTTVQRIPNVNRARLKRARWETITQLRGIPNVSCRIEMRPLGKRLHGRVAGAIQTPRPLGKLLRSLVV